MSEFHIDVGGAHDIYPDCAMVEVLCWESEYQSIWAGKTSVVVVAGAWLTGAWEVANRAVVLPWVSEVPVVSEVSMWV